MLSLGPGLTNELEKMRQKNEEMGQALREKSKKLMQIQELYDKLKRKAMIGELRNAASDAVNSNIEAVAAAGAMSSDNLIQPLPYLPQSVSPRHNPMATEGPEHMFPPGNSLRAHVRSNADVGWAKGQGQHCRF